MGIRSRVTKAKVVLVAAVTMALSFGASGMPPAHADHGIHTPYNCGNGSFLPLPFYLGAWGTYPCQYDYAWVEGNVTYVEDVLAPEPEPTSEPTTEPSPEPTKPGNGPKDKDR